MKLNREGFTIIELIVVVAILGILALLAGPRLLSYVEKAELTRIQHDVKVMETKMAEVLTQDNHKFNEWDDNEKDLGSLVLRKKLFEKEGIAKKIDTEHLYRKLTYLTADNKSMLGMGGDLYNLNNDELWTVETGYKIVPKKYSSEINTKLSGTFYTNSLGKVYYEHDRPLIKVGGKEELNCPYPEPDYVFEPGTGTIVKWNGTATHLFIPAAFRVEINDIEQCVPVKIIGVGAFANGSFTRVKIPQSVEEIQEESFMGGELIEIEIPHSVNVIGDKAFAGNQISPQNVVIKGDSNNVSIGLGTFSNNGPSRNTTVSPSFNAVTANDLGVIFDTSGGKIVGFRSAGLMNTNSSIKYNDTILVIPDKIEVNGEKYEVKEIDKGAFQGSGLIEVTLPQGLTKIHDYAFAGNQLIEVNIPKQIQHIGNYAFAFNEVEKQPTIKDITIQDNKYTGKFEDLDNKGNIVDINGNVIKKLDNSVDLLDYIFLISMSKFGIPVEYNPVPEVPLKIDIISQGYLHSGMNIQIDSNYDGNILDEEWKINGTTIDGKPNRKFEEGTHNIRVRILTEDGWSKWVQRTLVVNKEPFSMTQTGKYTGYDWEVPETGLYKFTVAGAKGGSGGRGRNCEENRYGGSGDSGSMITGEIYLEAGMVLTIHTGETGGNGSNNTNFNGGDGGNGGSGGYSSIRMEDGTVLIMARGGSGGAGGKSCGVGGRAPNGYSGRPGIGSDQIHESVQNTTTSSSLSTSGYVRIEQIITE